MNNSARPRNPKCAFVLHTGDVMNPLRRCTAGFFVSLFLACVWVANAQVETTTQEKKPEAPDPAGSWRGEHEEEGEVVKDLLRLNFDQKTKQVTGTYQGRIGPVDLKNGKLDGNRLTIEFVVDLNGQELVVKLAGDIKSDEMTGTV